MIVDIDDVVLTPDGNLSRWLEVRNPVVYKMQRKDFSFDQVNDNGGFVQIQINGIDLTSSFANGSLLYVQSDNGVYDASGLQTAEAFSGGNTLITTDIPYVSAAPGGFVNNNTLRSLYRVEVNVYNDADDSLLNVDPFIFSPNSKGEILVEISSILKSYLSPDNESVLSANLVSSDSNAFIKFYIKYTEVWTGSAETETDDSANTFFAVLGARQIPSAVGGNLSEYISFADDPGKFLTKLDVISAWEGYPLIVTAIVDDTITDDFYFDINGTDSADVALEGNLVNCIIAASTIDAIAETSILSGYIDDGIDTKVTADISVLVKEVCENPVMLLARNSLGGMFQWLFSYNQVYTFNYADGRKAKRYRMMASGLSLNEWECMNDFFFLGDVYRKNITEFTSSVDRTKILDGQQVYVLNADGTKLGVIVIPVDNEVQTKDFVHNFELVIEFPELF